MHKSCVYTTENSASKLNIAHCSYCTGDSQQVFPTAKQHQSTTEHENSNDSVSTFTNKHLMPVSRFFSSTCSYLHSCRTSSSTVEMLHDSVLHKFTVDTDMIGFLGVILGSALGESQMWTQHSYHYSVCHTAI